MSFTNQQRMKAMADRIVAQVKRSANKGLDSARIFLTARIKETLNVPAPKTAVRLPGVGKKKGAILTYRAVTPATVGAPPRKVTGRLLGSVTSKMVNGRTAVIGVNAKGDAPDFFPYPSYHEIKTPGMVGSGKHQFIKPTIEKYKKELAKIIGRSFSVKVL